MAELHNPPTVARPSEESSLLSHQEESAWTPDALCHVRGILQVLKALLFTIWRARVSNRCCRDRSDSLPEFAKAVNYSSSTNLTACGRVRQTMLLDTTTLS